MVFLGTPLGLVLFFHDADPPDYLPGIAIAFAVATKEICAGEITSEEYEERRLKLLRDVNIK